MDLKCLLLHNRYVTHMAYYLKQLYADFSIPLLASPDADYPDADPD